ncbi:CLUMA_CG020783, isoform A [Clunio marinus]|uniref:CLUMA_CG020783, isoform A n=1 Tax=Clunio marinus TaxID=568069 RepID=A0A1J1J608_9DIPT|nr:CLUMA_CG020783, isoform A [Clunio marinus]
MTSKCHIHEIASQQMKQRAIGQQQLDLHHFNKLAIYRLMFMSLNHQFNIYVSNASKEVQAEVVELYNACELSCGVKRRFMKKENNFNEEILHF